MQFNEYLEAQMKSKSYEQYISDAAQRVNRTLDDDQVDLMDQLATEIADKYDKDFDTVYSDLKKKVMKVKRK